MLKLGISVVVFLFSSSWAMAGASTPEAGKIYNGETQKEVNLYEIVSKVEPGSVVIVSEQHDMVKHHDNQYNFLKMLGHHKPGQIISVGMEFFYVGQQPFVDDYLQGKTAEKEFLEKLNWGGFSFDFYRDSVRYPLLSGGTTLAINAPRYLTRKIAKDGLDSLTEEDKLLIPEGFELGNDLYLDRFRKIFSGGGHDVPEETLMKYFTSQSLWDDTMANETAKYLEENPEHIFVIIVGDFHAAFNGGLPDRLAKRGLDKVTVISQVAVDGYTDEEKKSVIGLHPKYGKRADYIWLTKTDSAK